MSQDKETVLFWIRILALSATFIPVLYLHWIISLLNLEKSKKNLLIFSYLLTIFFALFSFSSLYVKDVKPVLNFPWWPQAGIVYTIYILIDYIGLCSYGFYLLLKSYKKVSGFKRKQIQYVIIGSLVGFGGGATNFPLWYSIPFPPYGTFLAFLYPLILSYAIVRHHLMNVKILLVEFFVALIAFF